MGLAEAVNVVLKQKYSDFSGRARRSEYWNWTLAFFIAVFGLEIVSIILAAVAKPLAVVMLLVILVVLLGTLVPGLAVAVRRLHDTGKSGLFLLITFIPFVGGLIVLVFMCLDSTPGDNQYGPNPKGVGGGM